MSKPIIRITIKTQLTKEAHEKLDDKLRELLEAWNIKAEIYDDMTGEVKVTRG